eukprot:5621727-Alexandrium_andersonii.AAC.1
MEPHRHAARGAANGTSRAAFPPWQPRLQAQACLSRSPRLPPTGWACLARWHAPSHEGASLSLIHI